MWLDSIAADAGLTGFGRGNLFRDCITHAANRLRIEDTVRRHPEILDIQIDRPIIVAGLPRSGTTHMLNLISAETRLRSLPYWDSIQPVPGPEDAHAPGEPDPRLVRAEVC